MPPSARDIDDSVDLAPWIRPLFFSLNLTGAVLLAVLVKTFSVSKRLYKQATLVNLCIAWIIEALSLSFLRFPNQVTGPQPSGAVGLTSAALTMAGGILAVFATFILVLNIWSVVTGFSNERHKCLSQWARTALCVITPCVVGLIFLLANILVGVAYPGLVLRNKFHCVVDSDALTNTAAILTLVMMVLTVILEIWIAVKLRATYRRLASCLHLDVPLTVRVLLFGSIHIICNRSRMCGHRRLYVADT